LQESLAALVEGRDLEKGGHGVEMARREKKSSS